MSRTEKKLKREKAQHKLGNQLSVLSNTGTKKQQKIVSQMRELYAQL